MRAVLHEMRWRVALLAVAIAAAALQSSSASKRVEILKQPRFIFDDQPIAFYVHVLPDPANRLLRVEAVDEVGSSVQAMERELDGDAAMRLWRIEWESVGAGDGSASV